MNSVRWGRGILLYWPPLSLQSAAKKCGLQMASPDVVWSVIIGHLNYVLSSRRVHVLVFMSLVV